ncbi:hypothetical protein EI555_021116, partial [Monodon monoceros]
FNICVILSALTAVYHRAAVAPPAAGVRETRADSFLPKVVFLLIHSLCNPFLKRFLGYIYGNKRRNSNLIMDFEERLLNTQRKR